MKKLKLANRILVVAAVLMMVFVFVGSSTANSVFTYLAIASAVIGLGAYLVLGRCPHCGKYLGWNGGGDCCPHCGKALGE